MSKSWVVSLMSLSSSSRFPRYVSQKGLLIAATEADTPQETARLEAQAFEIEQKTALAAEAKSVLDSWVRYEGQVKARQQKELADSIISKITKELENPKTLQQILNQSVADVESELRPSIRFLNFYANYSVQKLYHPRHSR